MKKIATRSAALILIACLSLGSASCTTTTGSVAPTTISSSGNVAAKRVPTPVNGNSVAKDLADGTLNVAANALGVVGVGMVVAGTIALSPWILDAHLQDR